MCRSRTLFSTESRRQIPTFRKLWKVLCAFTHATVYSQQAILDAEKNLDEIVLTFQITRALLECNHHRLTQHFVTRSMQYFEKAHGDGHEVPGLKTELRSLLTARTNTRAKDTLLMLPVQKLICSWLSFGRKMLAQRPYRRILGDFRLGKIDILVGTQMIAKGLHFPNVTLVGIIYADLTLHVPDFRAGERTFQLLTQVAGRAGRGDVEGEVIVQAFTPFHPAIQYARRHDFAGFYEQEIEFREQLRYPPLSRVALLTLKGHNEEKVKFFADHLRRELEKISPSLKDLILAGPAAAPLARAESNYRYQIMLRTRQMSKLSQRLAELTQTLSLPDDISWTLDIDPVDLA